jgi:hypothetical protein
MKDGYGEHRATAAEEPEGDADDEREEETEEGHQRILTPCPPLRQAERGEAWKDGAWSGQLLYYWIVV